MSTQPAVKYAKHAKEQMQQRIDAIMRRIAIAFVMCIIIFFYLLMLLP
ncbi:MAG TPA: hypothetical protein VHP12_06500 [Chitinophagaceae bacterium]|nr:hypothetical protein [Chitinophagaceae bacterium]